MLLAGSFGFNGPMRVPVIRSLWCLSCALAMPDSHAAASMLRCESGDHTVSYVSARIDNARCSSVAMNWSMPASSEPLPRRKPAARMYTYVEDGERHYVSSKPAGIDVAVLELHFMETCSLCASNDHVDVTALLLDTRSYRKEIDANAAAFGVDGALVRAVIHAESSYRANALSRAGAQGLMQLMPATASRFGVADPFDAAQNIRGGVQYLSWLLGRFKGNLDLALAAYNSGEASIDHYDGVPPYAETQTYVARVKALADRYRNGR
jgi:soluble lytic murein transglycosylase-like protein